MCYGLAHGGEVGPHQPGCEYYADGGQVSAPAQPQDNPSETVEHAAAEHGLLGLLSKSIGHSKLADPEKHVKVLDDAKAMHRHHSMGVPEDGVQEEAPKKTLGTQVGTHAFKGDHESAAELLQGHPLTGSMGKAHLQPALARLSGLMMEQDSDPEAMRSAMDYLHSSVKGANRIKKEGLLIKSGHEPDPISREQLKAKLDEVDENPQSLFDAGGKLGHYLPEHATALGSTLGNAISFLKTQKPIRPPAGPLDHEQSVDQLKEDKYNRALDIAQSPTLAFEHMRTGTVRPDDVLALKTMYPSLYQSMVTQVTDQLIEAQSKGEEIPYRVKQGMSVFLGQPLDGTMTPQAMQAIIKSATPAQPQQKPQGKESPITLKAVEKADQLYQMPDESRQMKKNKV